MKRYLVPAFFMIDVADNEDHCVADEIASAMQAEANSVRFGRTLGEHVLFLDEVQADRIIPIPSDATELPHTFTESAPCGDKCICSGCGNEHEVSKEESCSYCGSGLIQDEECQKCGL